MCIFSIIKTKNSRNIFISSLHIQQTFSKTHTRTHPILSTHFSSAYKDLTFSGSEEVVNQWLRISQHVSLLIALLLRFNVVTDSFSSSPANWTEDSRSARGDVVKGNKQTHTYQKKSSWQIHLRTSHSKSTDGPRNSICNFFVNRNNLIV